MGQRKERSDSLANRLEEAQYDHLREWLTMPGGTVAGAKELLESEYGVSASIGALHNFYHTHCVGFKMRKARELAAQVRKVLAETDDSFDEGTMALAEQRAFELAVENGGDVGDLVSLQKLKIERIKLQLQREKIEQDNRRIALLEKKAAFVDEMKDRAANREGGLTPEDMEEIERKLKLL